MIAVENVCAWPNLTLMRNGTIIAILHNQPGHGTMEGDVDCWASRDGLKWEKRSTVTRHEPQTIRMNHAAGLARNGDLVVLCSGWTNVQQPGQPKQALFRDAILRPWVLRSTDGGRTWEKRETFPAPGPGWSEFVPFGDIWAGEDSALHASCYQRNSSGPTHLAITEDRRCWHFRSNDDGWTWKPVSIIGPRHSETDIFPLGGKCWLAAARDNRAGVDLIRSDDNGATWQQPQPVTAKGELNGHLNRLKDGRLLLTYGVRVMGRHGVCAKFSSDDGRTWGEPLRLMSTGVPTDCGYPSSVQLASGAIVTAWYAKQTPEHKGYHMGVTVWEAPTVMRVDAASDSARQPVIEILHRSTIFEHTGTDSKDPANTTGFNHAPSVVLLPDGRLMTAWYSAPFEGSPKQKILSAFSSDQGRTWSAATTLQDFEDRADFDPAFAAAGKRTFLFFSATNPLRIYFRASNDAGRSWSPPQEAPVETSHTSRSNGIRLSTGELLVPLHRTGTRAGGVLKSRDGGKTWTRFGNVANPDGQGGEPTIAELRSGRVMMFLRTKDGELWRSFSADKGETWSTPEKTGLPATSSSHNLFRMRDGTLVLTHNPCKPPHRFPLTLRVSKDDGATWSEPAVIADRPEQAGGWQVSYPSVAELPDGTLVVVWTQIKSASRELYGDIQAARVALKPVTFK
ncbi:MAG: exo-alpha-sialidase [Verrucomicrobia bacterium]|nr:exo-alpha-sialidase [Verrucomicrobiota bacterium]